MTDKTMTFPLRAIANTRKTGEVFFKTLYYTIAFYVAPTLIWLVLIHMVGFEISWLKVCGIYLIFRILQYNHN